jgi:hypothetical protein
MTTQEQARQAIADYTEFLTLYSLEDERSTHAHERIKVLEGRVP